MNKEEIKNISNRIGYLTLEKGKRIWATGETKYEVIEKISKILGGEEIPKELIVWKR